MRGTLLACMLAAWSASASGQDATPAHQQTTPPPNGRFEIVQSPLAVRWTFRLDRFTGRVSQLVRTSDDGVAWEDMVVVDRPAAQASGKPRFQLFTSGLVARHTFLLDTDTGKTWQLLAEKRRSSGGVEVELHVWTPFEE